MSRILLFFILTTILIACAPLTPAPPGEPLPTAGLPTQGNWMICFTQSGGIMGMTREMVITSDGQIEASDERTSSAASARLSESELARLQELVKDLDYNIQFKPGTCVDCFIYTLEISSPSGKPFTAQADDVSVEPSGLSPLVEYLRMLMERSLKDQG